MNLKEINIRDPFIFADEKAKTYYMYASSPEHLGKGFCVYTSNDLINWIGPTSVFRSGDDFWGTQDFWAPEVHYYNGKYYLFGSFSDNGIMRNSQILVSDNLMGPFKVHSVPLAPDGWIALDATFYINEGTPYAIFSHEWVQAKDGEMCSIKLSDDLKATIGEPKILFSASSSGWSASPNWNTSASPIYVVDAPFVYNINGKEFMLWSS